MDNLNQFGRLYIIIYIYTQYIYIYIHDDGDMIMMDKFS